MFTYEMFRKTEQNSWRKQQCASDSYIPDNHAILSCFTIDRVLKLKRKYYELLHLVFHTANHILMQCCFPGKLCNLTVVRLKRSVSKWVQKKCKQMSELHDTRSLHNTGAFIAPIVMRH